MKKKTLLTIMIATLLLLCLAACDGVGRPEPTPEPTEVPLVAFQNGSFPADASSVKVVLEQGETALLDEFPYLEKVNANGSTCYTELLEYSAAHPELTVSFTVRLPNGVVVSKSAKEINLSGLKHGEVEETIAILRYYPELETLDLGAMEPPAPVEVMPEASEPQATTARYANGAENAEPAEKAVYPGLPAAEATGAEEPIGWGDVAEFQAAFPDKAVAAHFTLYGKEFTTADGQMVLSHRKMTDNGAAVYGVLPYMTRCTFLDMDSCGVPNEYMASIRDSFPNMKVVWRVWFGRNKDYTCRTDVTRILASSEGRYLDDWNSGGLYYCTDVVHMDIGHSSLYNLSFLYNMPKLEVLIIACAPWSDATPVSSLENLEYLEVLSTNCDDVSPFANLKNLKHLNIANCWRIKDITPLYGMTWLERLWIGCVDPVPQDQKDTIRMCLPDTEINTTVAFHKNGWSKDEMANNTPRYALLREQFGDYKSSAYCYSWADILYTKSIDELTEAEMALIKP